MRYSIALIVGVLVGLVLREQFGTPGAVVNCPELKIPQCPASPPCPSIDTNNQNLDTCLLQITALTKQNANILDDKESLAVSLARCNSEIDYWQGRVNGGEPELEKNPESDESEFGFFEFNFEDAVSGKE